MNLPWKLYMIYLWQMKFRPSVKHVFGVLEWFYMLTEKILFQNRGLVFYYPSRLPPPQFSKSLNFYDFFLLHFLNWGFNWNHCRFGDKNNNFRLPQDAYCDSALVPSGGSQNKLPRGCPHGMPTKPPLHQLPGDQACQLPRRVAGRVADGGRGQGSRAAKHLLQVREGKSALQRDPESRQTSFWGRPGMETRYMSKRVQHGFNVLSCTSLSQLAERVGGQLPPSMLDWLGSDIAKVTETLRY